MEYLEEVIEKSWETMRILDARNEKQEKFERLEREKQRRIE
jgi:hypothetical protein